MIDGIDIAWWGPRPDAAPTLVLLHEGLGSIGLWRDVPERLAAMTGYGVFAYSRRGYGRSVRYAAPWPLTYLHEEAALLPRVLDEAGIARALLVGHSDGGSIATIAAGSHQDHRIRGLALLAPHFFVEPDGVAAIAATTARYADGDLRARLAKHHDHVDDVFNGWSGVWLDPGFPAVLQLQPEIAHIRVPILIIQGGTDPYGTIAHARLAEAEAYCPVTILEVPEAGHAPHLEAPEPTLAAIAEMATRLFGQHETRVASAAQPAL